MSKLRIGLAGLGVVGVVVAQRLLGGAVEGAQLVAVSARSSKRNDIDISALEFESDPAALAARDDIDLVVELIGGEDGAALELVQAALANKKSVVTANKAMLAAHADALSSTNTPLAFEAAIAGGIPVVKVLREGLAGNNITALGGILNGTCNYILTRMECDNMSFADALVAAQTAGFAEADPTLDISGADAAQKLSLLGALAFNIRPDVSLWKEKRRVQGIETITARDIAFAKEFKHTIRLIAIGSREYMQVAPMLVPLTSPLAHITHETNAVFVDAEPVGRLLLQGAGAGGGATASAVLADIADIAAGRGRAAFAQPTSEMHESPAASTPKSSWYLRLMLADKAGSIAQITQILAENGVSVEEVVQRSKHSDDSRTPIGFITHKAAASEMAEVANALAQRDDICSDILTLPLYEEMK